MTHSDYLPSVLSTTVYPSQPQSKHCATHTAITDTMHHNTCQLVLQSIASTNTTSGSSNSFSKVLANFPSQYLFAIGFSPLFSLPWNIPPPLYCTLKQYDSTSSMSTHCVPRPNYWSITIYPVLFPKHFPARPTQCPTKLHPPRITTMPKNHTAVSCLWAPILFTRRYQRYHSYFLFLYLLRCFNSIGLSYSSQPVLLSEPLLSSVLVCPFSFP